MDEKAFADLMHKYFEDANFRMQLRDQLQLLRVGIQQVAKELQVNPEQDAVYLTAFTSWATAMSTGDLEESSRRLEGLSKDLLMSSGRLETTSTNLLSETKELSNLTRILLGLTGILGVLTAVSILRPWL